MDIKTSNLIDLIATTKAMDNNFKELDCALFGLRAMRGALDDLADQIAERKKLGDDGPMIRLSEEGQLTLAKRIVDLDRSLKLSHEAEIDAIEFTLLKEFVKDVRNNPERFELSDIITELAKMQVMQKTYEQFIEICYEIESDLLDTISAVTIGGAPYLDVRAALV